MQDTAKTVLNNAVMDTSVLMNVNILQKFTALLINATFQESSKSQNFVSLVCHF